jgi:cathepsin D
MAAYQRNTGSPHPLLGGITTSNKREVGSVQLVDDNDYLWYGTISIGSPPKDFLGVTLFSPVQDWPSDIVPFTVDFDTGSSDLFVPSTSCDSSCSGHTLYNPTDSSSSRNLGQPFSLAYGDGSTVSGDEYSDDVTIAGLVVR